MGCNQIQFSYCRYTESQFIVLRRLWQFQFNFNILRTELRLKTVSNRLTKSNWFAGKNFFIILLYCIVLYFLLMICETSCRTFHSPPNLKPDTAVNSKSSPCVQSRTSRTHVTPKKSYARGFTNEFLVSQEMKRVVSDYLFSASWFSHFLWCLAVLTYVEIVCGL